MPFFNSVYEKIRVETVIRKSRFIATLIPIHSKEEVAAELRAIRKEFSDATHNCYAYLLNETGTEMRFSDDGEPQGTAGLPILDVLKKRNIYKTLAVVTRYFGGIKLGANGLIGAYTDSIVNALDKADVRKNFLSKIIEISISYSADNSTASLIGKYGKILEREYSDHINIIASFPIENCDVFINNFTDVNCGSDGLIVKDGVYYIDYE